VAVFGEEVYVLEYTNSLKGWNEGEGWRPRVRKLSRDGKVTTLATIARDGLYAVLRDSLQEKDVLPLKDGEVLVVHHHRYLKKDDKEPPRFLVVRAAPDVDLDLADEPKAVKEGEEVVRIFLKLQPKAATALERLTTDRLGEQVVIVLGGEVVTMHKIREAIKGGDVQITSCAAGAAKYLLEQLHAHYKKK
jgi:preprotein translocase subunit SecD